MLKTNLVLDGALRIAELGCPALPCNLDKQPVLTALTENATTDPTQLGLWFTHPECLLAVKTSPDYDLFVLDVDPNGVAWLARNQDRILCKRLTRGGEESIFFIDSQTR